MDAFLLLLITFPPLPFSPYTTKRRMSKSNKSIVPAAAAAADEEETKETLGGEIVVMKTVRDVPYPWPMVKAWVGVYEMTLMGGHLGTSDFECTHKGKWIIRFRSGSLFRVDGVCLSDVVARMRDVAFLNEDSLGFSLLGEASRILCELHPILQKSPEELPMQRTFPTHEQMEWDACNKTWRIQFPSIYSSKGCSFRDVLSVVAQTMRWTIPIEQTDRLLHLANAYPAYVPSNPLPGDDDVISFDPPPERTEPLQAISTNGKKRKAGAMKRT